MDDAARLLNLKREYLVPCVYHFYKNPPVFVRGDGEFLFDSHGRRYLDCYSGVTVMSAGHSTPDIIEPAIEQLRQLQHTTSIYLTEPALALARAIAEKTTGGLKRSFFCASGSEANEGALLLATLATGRQDCVYLRDGLHGRTKWAMSVTGLDMWRTDAHPLVNAHAIPGPRDPDSLGQGQFAASMTRLAAAIESQPGARLPGMRRLAARKLAVEKGIEIPAALIAAYGMAL